MSTEPKPSIGQMVEGLSDKRHEIAGTIEGLQLQVKKAVADLDRVEATIRIFKPDIDLSELPARPVPPIHSAFKGEVSRIIFGAMRAAKRPMTCRELTEILMRERGLPIEDKKLMRTMTGRVGSMLNHWRRVRGVLKSSPGEGQTLLWEINRKRIVDGRRRQIPQ
jgi:hypothetical protein